MTKLKPCPFCGKEAVLKGFGVAIREWIVRCSYDNHCGVAPKTSTFLDKDAAIKLWNQRATDASKARMLESLRTIAQLLQNPADAGHLINGGNAFKLARDTYIAESEAI